MAHTCTRCGDPATTLTDTGDLLCDDCNTTSRHSRQQRASAVVGSPGGL